MASEASCVCRTQRIGFIQGLRTRFPIEESHAPHCRPRGAAGSLCIRHLHCVLKSKVFKGLGRLANVCDSFLSGWNLYVSGTFCLSCSVSVCNTLREVEQFGSRTCGTRPAFPGAIKISMTAIAVIRGSGSSNTVNSGLASLGFYSFPLIQMRCGTHSEGRPRRSCATPGKSR